MGAVDTTYTFTATDTITSTKMNNIIDQTTITGDAILGTTLEVVSGKLKVRAQNITSNELATDAVTSTKIVNGAVTPSKLSTGAPTWNSAGGVAVSSVVYLANDGFRFSSDGAVDTGMSWDGDGVMNVICNAVVVGRFNSSGWTGSAGSAGNGAKAWVNFSGMGPVGANMTIRANGNVSSVNKTATGVYRVTFATAMPDANYAAIVGSDANSPHKIGGVVTQTSGYVDIAYSQINTSSARENPDWGQVSIFR